MIPKISKIQFPSFNDVRGTVFPFEFEGLPFQPQRFFITQVNLPGTIRGEHGHLKCEQILFSIRGSLTIQTYTHFGLEDFTLEPNGNAIYLPAGIWASQLFANGDEILGCLASHPYDENDIFKTLPC